MRPLASRGSIFEGTEGLKNSLKPYPDLFIKINYPKTISGPIKSFLVMENHIGSVVSKILRPKQKTILLHILGYVIILLTVGNKVHCSFAQNS